MPIDVSNYTGGGVTEALIDTAISLPDAGTSVTISGQVQQPLASGGTTAPIPITGSPVTMPAVPGAGSTYWIIQVNFTTGAATVKSSSSSMPAADPGNLMVFQQTLPSTAGADPALDGLDATPDTF